jgi:hypothetical protein
VRRRPRGLITVAASLVALGIEADAGAAAPPVAPGAATDASAAAPVPRAVIACERVGTTLLVPVRINGGPPRWFVLDTGANSCLVDAALARALRLPARSLGSATGAGKGSVPIQHLDSTAVEFTVGGERCHCQHALSIDLSNQLGILGHTVDGILGSDFISQYVVELDYEDALVRLYDAGADLSAPGARVVPLAFDHRVPHLAAIITVAGRAPENRQLLVDSGSQDAVDDSLVLRSSAPKAEVVGGVGIGEEYRVTFGRLDRVEIDDLAFERVPSVAPGVALVGGEVLARFRVTLDYGRSRMLLAPNRHLRDGFPLDASGLDLRWNAAGGSITIHDVQRGSAAEQAGIRTGDELHAIDGIAVASLGLPRVQRMLTADGSTLGLELSRGRERLNLRLTLRSWLPPD